MYVHLYVCAYVLCLNTCSALPLISVCCICDIWCFGDVCKCGMYCLRHACCICDT
jgi:hypothetical protein